MNNLFNSEEIYDFDLNVSSATYKSWANQFDPTKCSVGVQAYSKNSQNCGDLKMDNVEIPFTSSNTYFLQNSAQNPYSNFIGKQVNFNLVSNSSEMNSFNISPSILKIPNPTYHGINNEGVLPLNQDFMITWEEDIANSTNDVVIIMQGEFYNSNEVVSKYKIVKENEKEVTFSIDELAFLSQCNTTKIFMARGVVKKHNINSKTLSISNINYTWTKVKI